MIYPNKFSLEVYWLPFEIQQNSITMLNKVSYKNTTQVDRI